MPNVKYECKFCGRIFNDAKDAEYCESLHAKVKGIDMTKVHYNQNYVYPSIIYVEFDNDQTMEYRAV